MKFDELLKIFESTFLEKKDHLINKLPNLSPEEKTEIINFYTKKNWDVNLEKMINWSNKDLTYDDFKPVLNYVSKTGREKAVKLGGISGLKEGEDYLKLKTDGTYQAYRPLNYEASKLIASDSIGGCEGKWCTSYQKDSSHWYVYVKTSVLVYIIAENEKYALLINKNDFTKYKIYDKDDDVYKRSTKHWYDRNNAKYKLSDFDKLMLTKFDKLISDNKEILKAKAKFDLSRYLSGNNVDLRNEKDRARLVSILIESVNYPQYTFILPENCSELFLQNEDIIGECGSNWDTSHVTSMRNMFNCAIYAKPITTAWKVDNVKDMSGMFNYAKVANPDVKNWNVENVVNMYMMFRIIRNANPNVENWNVEKVVNMGYMFSGCTGATPNFKKWKIPKLKNVEDMFNGARKSKVDNIGIEDWVQYKNISKQFKTVKELKNELLGIIN